MLFAFEAIVNTNNKKALTPKCMMTLCGHTFCMTGLCANNTIVESEFPAQRTNKQSFNGFFVVSMDMVLKKRPTGQ